MLNSISETNLPVYSFETFLQPHFQVVYTALVSKVKIHFLRSALNLLQHADCFEMPHLLHATKFHKDIV